MSARSGSSQSFPIGPVLLVGLLLGAALATAPLPARLPAVSEHIYWYLGRSAGFVAYWLLFVSIVMGLAVSSRFFDGLLGRPWVFEVHKFVSVFVLVAMTFHVLILLPDPYANFRLSELFVPFDSHYRPAAVALGIFTFYGSALVSASFYFKGIIGQNGWRLAHYATFALFLGALAHGLWAGTDGGKTVVQASYLASGLAVLFLTFFRVLATRASGTAKVKPKTAAAVAASEA